MSMDAKLEAIEDGAAKEILVKFLKAYTSPAFGALPKREIDLIVYEMLQEAGALELEPSMYELMRDLKITRTKARNLVYDSKIRKHSGSSSDFDDAIKNLFLEAKFSKDANYFVLEVEDPLLHAEIKERVRTLGYVSDTSFNSAIIRMPLKAVAKVVEDLLDKKDHKKIEKALRKAGASGKGVSGLLVSAFKTVGKKVVGDAADDLAEGISDKIGEYLAPVFSVADEGIATTWEALLSENEGE